MMNKDYLRFEFLSNIVCRMVLFPALILLFLLSCGSGGPESSEEIFARAGEAFRSGDLEEASSLLVQVSELDPQNPNVWYNLGTVRLNQGYFGESISAYQKVIELDSTRVDALIGLTGALTGAGRYDEAIAAGSLSVQCNPQDGMAFNNYGMALMETGNFQSAAVCFSTALRRDPENPSILYNCGRMSLFAGDFPGALNFFHSATEIDPGHFGARLEAARTYGMLERHAEAEQTALALLASYPGDIDALEVLALSCSGQGRYTEALEILQEILAVRPNHMKSILGVAECLYMMEDSSGALEQYRYFMSLLEDTAGTSGIRGRIAELEDSID